MFKKHFLNNIYRLLNMTVILFDHPLSDFLFKNALFPLVLHKENNYFNQ